MNLKTPLSLSVYWLTPAAVEAEKLGIECEDDSVLTSVTFYTVDHIIEYTPLINERPATRIFSGGHDYLTNHDYNSLKQLILTHI